MLPSIIPPNTAHQYCSHPLPSSRFLLPSSLSPTCTRIPSARQRIHIIRVTKTYNHLPHPTPPRRPRPSPASAAAHTLAAAPSSRHPSYPAAGTHHASCLAAGTRRTAAAGTCLAAEGSHRHRRTLAAAGRTSRRRRRRTGRQEGRLSASTCRGTRRGPSFAAAGPDLGTSFAVADRARENCCFGYSSRHSNRRRRRRERGTSCIHCATFRLGRQTRICPEEGRRGRCMSAVAVRRQRDCTVSGSGSPKLSVCLCNPGPGWRTPCHRTRRSCS